MAPFTPCQIEDVELPEMVGGCVRPNCICGKCLPDDYEEALRMAGRIYGYVLPGESGDVFRDEVCDAIADMLDYSGDMGFAERRGAFSTGFKESPSVCASLIKDHSVCGSCPYHVYCPSLDNSSLKAAGLSYLELCDVSALSLLSVDCKEFYIDVRGNNRVAVEPCVCNSCVSLILYMNSRYYVCPVSVRDSGYRIVAREVLLNKRIIKISAMPYLLCMLVNNFSGESYDERKSPLVSNYGGIRNLYCLSEYFPSGLRFDTEKYFLESLEIELLKLGYRGSDFSSRIALMKTYSRIRGFLESKGNKISEDSSRLVHILWRMLPVPDENGLCGSELNPLLLMSETGEIVFAPTVRPRFSDEYGVYRVSVTKSTDPWRIVGGFVLVLGNVGAYKKLGIRIVSISPDNVSLLYPISAKDSVYDILNLAVVRASGVMGSESKLRIESI